MLKRAVVLPRTAALVQILIPLLFLSGVLLTPAGPMPAAATDTDTLAKEAQDLLRAAERDMFSGKKEQASQKLDDAGKLIEELKAADPEHAKLKGLESKYTKVRKDLDKRLGKAAAGAGSATKPADKAESAASDAETESAATADQAESAATAVTDKLPAGVTKRLKEIGTHLDQVDAILAGDATPEKRAKNADYKLGRARELLREIDTNYGTQIAADQPEYLAAQQGVAEREAQIAAITADLDQAAATEAAAIADASKDYESDRARVLALYDRFHDQLDLIHGNSMVYGADLASAEKALTEIEAVEGEVLPELQPALAELAPKYGTDAMTINNLVHSWGIDADSQFGNRLEWLIEAAGKVPKSRAASAASIAQREKMFLDGIDGVPAELRINRMQEIRSKLLVGQKLDPNNSDVNDMLATIDQRISDMSASIEEEIDAKTWAGDVSSFSGPGKVKDLAEKALAYFRADRAWGGNPDKRVEILKVAIRGPWKVAEKDIFGQVTRWRLPIHVAVTDENYRAKNIAKVFELSIVAMEGAGNKAPQEPPFDGFWVGNNWMMRLDKL